MIDISKGRYWGLPWSLVDGCTPCSPGCDHCWSAAIAKRFYYKNLIFAHQELVDVRGKFTGLIHTRPERLNIPLKRKKPTVYAIWNDLFHEGVTDRFIDGAWSLISKTPQHTFLILTKRPERMADFVSEVGVFNYDILPNLFLGLTVCNQQEADEKIPVFLRVPGKKFLSIEPMLSEIKLGGFDGKTYRPWFDHVAQPKMIDAVILGGETGPGARPMNPEWVRSVRDQCEQAGVPFFFKSWGKHTPELKTRLGHAYDALIGGMPGGFEIRNNKRLLDGRTHDDLPWHKTT